MPQGAESGALFPHLRHHTDAGIYHQHMRMVRGSFALDNSRSLGGLDSPALYAAAMPPHRLLSCGRDKTMPDMIGDADSRE